MGCSACGVYVRFRVHLPGNRNRTPITNWLETHDIATASPVITLTKVTCDSQCPQGNNTPPGLTIQHLAHLRLRGCFHKDFNGHTPPISSSFFVEEAIATLVRVGWTGERKFPCLSVLDGQSGLSMPSWQKALSNRQRLCEDDASVSISTGLAGQNPLLSAAGDL